MMHPRLALPWVLMALGLALGCGGDTPDSSEAATAN